MTAKKEYIPPVIEIIKFQTEDILTTSGVNEWFDPDELPDD